MKIILEVITLKKIILKLANREITLTPIGTVLIGSKGRIDMSSSIGEVKFVLVEKDLKNINTMPTNSAEWNWKISTTPPLIKFIELNEDSFSDAPMEVLNV